MGANRDLFNSVGPNAAMGGQAYFERPNLSQSEAAAWEVQAQRFGGGMAEGYDNVSPQRQPAVGGNELVFRVKLTKAEYQMYLRQKEIRS